MRIPDTSDGITVQMPAWNALYQIRDFGSHLQQVEAHYGDKAARSRKSTSKPGKSKARARSKSSTALIWDEPGPFATQLNAEHAFINPAMILHVCGRTHRSRGKVIRSAQRPAGFLARREPPEARLRDRRRQALLSSRASGYDDSLIHRSKSGNSRTFEVPGVEPAVHVVVHGDKWEKSVENQLQRICAYELKLMEVRHTQRYTFILHLGKAPGAAAAEWSTRFHSDRRAVREGEFLNVAAHEFFHLWNVKRIHPAALDPVDYTKEQYTRALWFAEGVTNTYAAYTLVRTGLWNKHALR